MIHRYRLHHRNTRVRDDICAWLRANDIDPDDVPLFGEVVIADGQITYERFARGERGRLPGSVRVAVPLLAPMPPELDARADWRIPPRLCDCCRVEMETT